MKDISDQEFKNTVLLALQVASTHLCALALASKIPNPNFGKPMNRPQDVAEQGKGASKAKDKRVYVPLSHSEQLYHIGSQQQLNILIDGLVGTDEEEEALKPHLVPSEEGTKGGNVTPLRGQSETGAD